MFKGASLSAKLYMGFTAVLAIAVALGVFAYTRLLQIDEDTKVITENAMPGIFLAEEIQKLTQENYILTTKHIMTADKAGMEVIEAEMAKVKGEIDGLLKEYEKSINSEKGRDLFTKVGQARETFVTTRNRDVLPLSRENKVKEAMEVVTSKLDPAFQAYLAACAAMVELRKGNGDRAAGEIADSVGAAEKGILIGLLAALAAGASIGIFLSRSISSSLNQVISSLSSGSEQVSSASNQVSQSSQQMAEGASQQASSLEETSASLEEMSSMTRQNSDNAKQANIMATETRGAVEKSREAMSRMGDAIGKIKGSSDQTAKIIKTIDEIAFQTNLLALNAAVEAARAGDAGKGFAVVAEEVRNLAQRSAEAAKSTASLIEESQQNANNGVAVSKEVGEILTQIVGSVGKLSQLIGEVSSASQEQTKGIEQIGTAVTEMDKLTQSNAANAEESASASEELFAQAKELSDMVSVLVGIVKGAGAAGAQTGTQGRASAGLKSGPGAAKQAAVRKDRAPAKAGAARSPGKDWSPAPPKGVLAHAGKNGHAVSAHGKALRPDQVIPMDDSDLQDF